jgi:hypothetical protein
MTMKTSTTTTKTVTARIVPLKKAGIAAQRALLAALVCVLLGGADSCSPPLNQDPGFDLWCGNRLCAWNLEYGAVQRVPTWHRSDFGASLIGAKVSMWQDLNHASTVDCFKITLQADKDEGVDLALSFDFYKDGTVEYSHPLVSDDFRTVVYELRAPTYFDDLRLRIVKTGVGRAILTRVRIDSSSDCVGPPIDTNGRPIGIVCEKDAQCQSNRCASVLQWSAKGPFGGTHESTCATCKTDADCNKGEVCGQLMSETYSGGWYRGCVAPQAKGLADRCAVDAECASGVCCQSTCSECCPSQSGQAAVLCAGGATCAQRFPSCGPNKNCQAWTNQGPNAPLDGQLSAWQCDPGAGKGQPGDACLRDADCASARCKGSALKQCMLTGERCKEDDDCMAIACLEIGVADGSCD